MSCIKEGNVRCTKCCEVLHIDGKSWNRLIYGKITVMDQEFMLENFVRVSKRKAKKLNPYIFTRHYVDKDQHDYHRSWLSNAAFFTCKSLIKGICTKYESRPQTCRVFSGNIDYSPTCPQDISIIARST